MKAALFAPFVHEMSQRRCHRRHRRACAPPHWARPVLGDNISDHVKHKTPKKKQKTRLLHVRCNPDFSISKIKKTLVWQTDFQWLPTLCCMSDCGMYIIGPQSVYCVAGYSDGRVTFVQLMCVMLCLRSLVEPPLSVAFCHGRQLAQDSFVRYCGDGSGVYAPIDGVRGVLGKLQLVVPGPKESKGSGRGAAPQLLLVLGQHVEAVRPFLGFSIQKGGDEVVEGRGPFGAVRGHLPPRGRRRPRP